MNTLVKPPNFLQRLSTDEYSPMPYSKADLRVINRTTETLLDSAKRRNMRPYLLSTDRLATAAALRALNTEWGHEYYEVPAEAEIDDAAAADVFRGQGIVIDVQTHFISRPEYANRPQIHEHYREIMPDWWQQIDDNSSISLTDYIKNVFLDTETAVAVLTSGPGFGNERLVFNDEMAGTRTLFDVMAGKGRLLNHAVVHANVPEEFEAMEEWKKTFKPVGWKVYTMGRITPEGWASGWMLDDETYGLPFLERAQKLDVPLICAHKGLSQLADNGSPRDIGPAAKAFPNLKFLIYHSGYEFALNGQPPEGPFKEGVVHYGTDRLIASSRDAGLGPGSNIYPELGTTWFSLIRRPEEAAHVLGKLIAHFGEDNVIWGSDGIFYGSVQSIIDAFRSFQIPDEMCRKYGYAKLTPAIKEKILSRNAARIYNIDLAAAAHRAKNDDLAWTSAMLAEVKRSDILI